MSMHPSPEAEDWTTDLPRKGQRVELFRTRTGVRVRLRGTVQYADDLQILVKWDKGPSEALRPGVDRYRILE